MPHNPLLMEFNAPYSLPPFGEIRSEHYEPAFMTAIEKHQREIQELAENSASPDFFNTIEAFHETGSLLQKVNLIFSAVKQANSDQEIRAIGEKIAARLAQHEDTIYLNDALFRRIDAVYQRKEILDVNEVQKKLLEDLWKRFKRRGAGLPPDKKARLAALNEELTVLSEQFSNNVRHETKSFALVISDPRDISGLAKDVVDSAAQDAEKRGMKGSWSFTTDRASITPFLTYADNRELRRKLFEAYTNRGSDPKGNIAIATKIASLRAERAQMLGFKTHAHYVLDNQMARTPEQVYELLDSIWPQALDAAKRDRAIMMELAKKHDDQIELKPWDWWYYAEKLRKQNFDFDESVVKAFFSLEATREGAFFVAHKLFGLTFKERHDLPVYHEDVRTFEVFDSRGDIVGIFYVDYFTREGKQSGAWMDAIRQQKRENSKRVIPVIINVLNLTKPAQGQPPLLSFEEVKTLFHEFGHALHGLLSDVNYMEQSGTNVPRDFVEFPSQIYENWMLEEEVLTHYAKHYQTNEPLPQALLEKIKAAARFNMGFKTVEYLAAAYLDLAWHTLPEASLVNASKLEATLLQKIGLIDEIVPRYKTGYFLHAFAWDYSAGFYSYLWSQVLDADAFSLFKKQGIFDPALAKRYQALLAQGGSKKAEILYEEFSGGRPNRDALLKRFGF